MIKEGDIIRCAFQQHDGEYVKRPALILKKVSDYNDFVVVTVALARV